jgi:ADP-ribose pyrophosphatase
MYHKRPKHKKSGKVLKKWEVLSTEELFAAPPWVRVFTDRIRLPSGRIVPDYYRVELPEYAMVFAQTDDGKVLFERQYKHALGRITLALPTGCVEKGESPIETAKRELLEETGYKANKWRFVGSFLVDGNKGCGKAHFYIAEKLEKVADPVNDDAEESEILFMPINSIMKAILNGEISLLATAALLAISTNPNLDELLTNSPAV